jgi:hypothetical protein
MATRRRRVVTKVTAFLPVSSELTKLKSGRSLEFTVKRGGKKLGTLFLGRGSVEWWPRSNKTNSFKRTWAAFADMLNEIMIKH